MVNKALNQVIFRILIITVGRIKLIVRKERNW